MTIEVKHLKLELEMSEGKRIRLQRNNLITSLEPEDSNIWIMLDVMTLLLIFFIVLYMNLLSEKNRPQSFLTPIMKILSTTSIVNPPLKKLPGDKIEELRIKKNIQNAMSGMAINEYSINISNSRTMLTLSDGISFKSGSAELTDEIKLPLEKIAAFLKREYVYKLVVSGHTDNHPIHTDLFPSNWELSVARALSVAKYLISHRVDPNDVSVEGFGQYSPVSNNGTHEGRRTNRRVEITIFKDPVL